MSMDYQLEDAVFRGVKFEVVRLGGRPSARRWAEYQYPGRDGSDFEDRGREPQRYQFSAIFHGPEYEAALDQFLSVVDAGKSGTFQHPTMGTFTARVSITGFEQSAEERDTARVEIDVVEDGTATALPDLFSIGGLAAEVTYWCDYIEDLGSDETDVTTAWEDAKAWAANVKAGVQGAINQINAVRRKIDSALKTMEDLTNPSNWQIVRSLKRLNYSCQKLARRAQNIVPRIRNQVISVPLPLPLLAHKLYGSRSKADQLVTANPSIRNPFRVEPTELRAPSDT